MCAQKTDVKTNIDLNCGELRNPVVHPVAAFPESPVYGQVCTISGELYCYTSIGWLKCTIQIATDEQAEAGESEVVAVNPKQMSVKANSSDVATALALKQNNLTDAQMSAVNSGANSTNIGLFNTHIENTGIHVSSEEKTTWNNKQNALTEAQQNAANSGVTADDVSKIYENASEILSLQGAVANNTMDILALDSGKMDASVKYCASFSLDLDHDTYVVTIQLKDQDGNNLGSAQHIDLPLESVVVNGSYDEENKEIILTLENGNTIEIPVGDLVAGLQTEITEQNKLSADLVDDTNSSHKFATAQEKTTWNGKQDAISDLDAIRSGASAGATALQPSALNGYATELWVGNQGYLKQAVDDSSTTSTTLGWSASKLNGIIGDIESLLYNINSGS